MPEQPECYCQLPSCRICGNVRNLDDYRKPEPYGDPPEFRFSPNQAVAIIVGLSLLAASILAIVVIVLLFL
jgi:hypothetical protein